MKSWFVVFTVLLFGTSLHVSADEFLSSGYGNSMFESPFEKNNAENKADLWYANSYLPTPGLHLTPLNMLSPGGLDQAASITTSYLSGISMTSQTLELTPIFGYTVGGRFDYEEDDGSEETIEISDASSFGFRLGYNLTDNSQIEFIYSRQETEITGGDLFPTDALFDLNVNYFHLGGTLLWNRGNGVEPYFTGTLGATNFDPDDSSFDSLTRFSMGFGGGVRVFPLERLGIYTGARGLVTFVNSEMEGYSGSKGTYVRIEADAVWQFQIYAGLIFAF